MVALRNARLGIQRVRWNSSLSALAYKAMQRNMQRPPLPTIEAPSWSRDAAISSILYETPVPKRNTSNTHVLQCLVQNEPGVLARVSSALAGRGFNIDSLVVSNTEVQELSRMTIVLQGDAGVIEQARRQLEDLVPVWAVLDYTDAPLVARELLLAKISLLGPEYFADLVAHHGHAHKAQIGEAAPGATQEQLDYRKEKYHPSNIPLSEQLRHKHAHLEAITKLSKHYGGKIADISERNCIVELCAEPERISRFLRHIKPFGVIETVRTGISVLTKTPMDGEYDVEEAPKEVVEELGDLPPG